MAKEKQPVFGLSSQEAEKRLLKYGPNKIEEQKKLSLFGLVLDQFKSPLIYILFFAGLISLFLKEWTDSVVIFLAVLMNTVLGFIQEYKAEKSLLALKKFLVPHVKVIRDGQKQVVEAKNLVPGDLVILSTGCRVPADGTVIESVNLHVNEAMITGESVPVEKNNQEDVFMGTTIVSGRGKMLVAKTGMKTKIGAIAFHLKKTIREETPLKKQISHLSKILAIIFAVICLLIFLEGLWKGRDFLAMMTLSVAVAVAAIPEGLAVSLTVILSLGMQRILKKKGLVRKLLAAETLGSVDVICADKTGTLTQGKMKVVQAVASQKNKPAIKRAAILCNNMVNPLEISMMEWAKNQLKINNINSLINKFKRVDEIPFSSVRKFIAVLVQGEKKGQGEIILSGAPEMVMEMSAMDKNEQSNWQKKLDKFTKKGLRVVAFSSVQGNLTRLQANFDHLKQGLEKYNGQLNYDAYSLKLNFLGLLLFADPVRLEVKKALNLCQQAGIQVKVITGDYRNTAVAVLNKLAIAGGKIKENQILEGWQLDKISDQKLFKKIDNIYLFCRTTPEQKIRIVQALQEKGHSVAMMGDGVNDALALKKADIGVVVAEASEVAKETADMVLLDSNFNTVVAAVEEGRGVFENIKKVVLYLLSSSFTEVILISGSLLLNLPMPVTAVQILWVNLIQDGLPDLALAFEPKEKHLMTEKPRKKNAPILDAELKALIFIIGILTDFFLLAVFIILMKFNFDLKLSQSIIFAALGTNSLFYAFSCKSLRRNIWQTDLFNNKFLLGAVLFGFLMMFSALYWPKFQFFLKTVNLNLASMLLILFLGGLNIALIEAVKWLFLKKRKSAIVN